MHRAQAASNETLRCLVKTQNGSGQLVWIPTAGRPSARVKLTFDTTTSSVTAAAQHHMSCASLTSAPQTFYSTARRLRASTPGGVTALVASPASTQVALHDIGDSVVCLGTTATRPLRTEYPRFRGRTAQYRTQHGRLVQPRRDAMVATATPTSKANGPLPASSVRVGRSICQPPHWLLRATTRRQPYACAAMTRTLIATHRQTFCEPNRV